MAVCLFRDILYGVEWPKPRRKKTKKKTDERVSKIILKKKVFKTDFLRDDG